MAWAGVEMAMGRWRMVWVRWRRHGPGGDGVGGVEMVWRVDGCGCGGVVRVRWRQCKRGGDDTGEVERV